MLHSMELMDCGKGNWVMLLRYHAHPEMDYWVCDGESCDMSGAIMAQTGMMNKLMISMGIALC